MNTSPKSSKAAGPADTEAPPAAADAVAAEIVALRAEVAALVEQFGAVRAAAKGGAKRAARAIAAEGADAGAEAAEDLLAEWRALDARVVAEARDNPWRALGLAALIGLVFGLILRR